MSDDKYSGHDRTDRPSGNLPDDYDLTLGKLHGLPGAAMTKPAIREVIEPVVGNARTFIVRTVREQDEHADKPSERGPRFTILLQVTGRVERPIRLVIPPAVADLIARQRDALAGVARKKSARQAVETKRAAGIPVGNPAALRRARKRSRKGGAR